MSIGSLLGGLAMNFLVPGSGILGGILGATGGGLLESKLFNKEDTGGIDMAKWNAGPEQQEGWDRNLYKSRYTNSDGVAPHFDTPEERDAYDRSQESQQNQAIEPVYTSAANGGLMQFYKGGEISSTGGGLIQGPGTVTSDSIPGVIQQNGRPVENIAVANGEVIFSGKDLAALDPSGDMKRAGMRLGGAANGSRGAEAARMFAEANRNKG